MSERQTSVQADKKGAKRCSLCGARLWLKDYASNSWSGPWHFNDCPEVPGGAELSARNIEAQMRYAEEKVVPKAQGARILRAIYTMLDSPTREVMLARRAAILEELQNYEEVRRCPGTAGY